MPAPLILIVDDDRLTRWSLATVLGRLGYEVETASSAQECLSALAACLPALVLLDVMLPDMDGYGVLAKIRAGLPALPVLLMSAHTLQDTAARARRAGAAGFLEKPCDPGLLEEAILQALQEKPNCGESRTH